LDSPRATFPIAIGPKDVSHEDLEEIIGKDLLQMKQRQTVAVLGGDKFRNQALAVAFSAEMYLSLGDQPERRDGNGLMRGNSLSHLRWQMAADHNLLAKVLPPCEVCLDQMKLADRFLYLSLANAQRAPTGWPT
jgi:hypothetical protein